jgi:hypothetical protein
LEGKLKGHEATSLPDSKAVEIDSYFQISLPHVEEPSLEEKHTCQKRSMRSVTLIYHVKNGR